MERCDPFRIEFVFIGCLAALVLGSTGVCEATIVRSDPTPVSPPLQPSGIVQECDFTSDGLELYVGCSEGIRVATRETTHSEWGPLGPVIMSGYHPAISPDGRELYFDLPGDSTLWVATRQRPGDPWSEPARVGPPVGASAAQRADVSRDGLSLYFASPRPGGYGDEDIWVASRATTVDGWGEPVNLGPNINGPRGDVRPSISSDGLTLVFSRTLPWSLWVSTRKSVDADWGPAVNLSLVMPYGSYGPARYFYGPALSPDGSALYFDATDGHGGESLWQIQFDPILDLNGDGVIDDADVDILIAHWHTDNVLCDIAPLPMGDGYVDIKDLLMLTEHLGEDLRVVAYWRLDETQGDTAIERTGRFPGNLAGSPVWQPDNGAVGGALKLDGVDDYVWAHFYLSPGHGPWSAWAWVKGGAPGQVLVSQQNGANWLYADPTDGTLATECAGRFEDALCSEAVITDGQWHPIALVWDGASRFLYVDGKEVACETRETIGKSEGRLTLGAGKTLAPGTFWSGLIDDVRIYDQAVKP